MGKPDQTRPSFLMLDLPKDYYHLSEEVLRAVVTTSYIGAGLNRST